MRDAALELAKRFPVFPLWPVLPAKHTVGFVCACGKLGCKSPGKHPLSSLAPHGLKDATQDPKRVEWFWSGAPDANIGIATGHGVNVLDIDPRHGGDQSIAELQKRYGRLPKTLAARTGGGGWHVYFAGNLPNSVAALGPGIDIRGDGGYAVAPPSLHISGGQYRWCGDPDRPLAPLPEWISSAQANSAKRGKTPEDWRNLVCRDVTEGERNDTLARYAGYLLRRYVDPAMVLDLLHCWNDCRCNPPLSEDEVVTIVNSVCGRELKRRETDG